MLSKSNRGGKNLEDSYNRCFIQMLLFDNGFDWTRKGQKKQEKKIGSKSAVSQTNNFGI